jgi:hypothetical protein
VDLRCVASCCKRLLCLFAESGQVDDDSRVGAGVVRRKKFDGGISLQPCRQRLTRSGGCLHDLSSLRTHWERHSVEDSPWPFPFLCCSRSA